MSIPETMQAILLTGYGGLDRLKVVDDHPVPVPDEGEVLIEVGAAGVNNTDINTRTGWYAQSVTGGTGEGAADGYGDVDTGKSSWSGAALTFPRIQGADVCGRIVAAGSKTDEGRIGERVLVQSMQPQEPEENGLAILTFGADFDGGFAEYAVAKSDMTLSVESLLSDVELASFPCAYSTAENMLERIGLGEGETVLITGASGGVGSAAVQLAKRRGAHIIAVASRSKHDFVTGLGADRLVDRGDDLIEAVGEMAVDVVVDLVAGAQWPSLIACLRRGGRYVSAGAIGGPICELDLRTLYLHDLTLAGSTYQPKSVFENLVGYIERGEIRPVVSKVYGFSQVAEAQTDFIEKHYPGKLVMVPDRLAEGAGS
tara:strand:+ start:4386 stop:5498 length:1113 start_codon:yes stop_codon:yes gene_type:complete